MVQGVSSAAEILRQNPGLAILLFVSATVLHSHTFRPRWSTADDYGIGSCALRPWTFA